MTEFQRGAHAGLMVGAPAVARLYAAICASPGMSEGEAARASQSKQPVTHCRVMKLEDVGLIKTRLEPRRTGVKRTCYPKGEMK